MGNQAPQLVYSVECSEKKEGETSIRRSPISVLGLKKQPEKDIFTMQDAWIRVVKNCGDQQFLFTRNKKTNIYEGKTYNEVNQLARALGSAIIHEKLCYESNDDSRFPGLKMLGIFAKNCEEWTIFDVSNMLYGHVAIPLYDTLGPQNITYCLKHSGIITCIASGASVSQFVKTSDIGSLRNIIAFDDVKPEDKHALEARGVKFYSWDAIISTGKLNPKDIVQVKETDCLTFSYTSGTTGDPKAAMMSHQNFNSILAALKFHPNVKFYPDDVHLSYLPMPHVFERVFVYAVLSQGAKIYFYSGDVQKLKDDLAVVKPTFFISVPRLYNRFYDLINQQFEKQTGIQKFLLNMALSTKFEGIKTGKCTHALYDKLIFAKTKQLFGGRCRFLATSSAPISKDVIDFMKVISCVPMIEGYGQTESTGATFTTFFEDPESGHCGGPTAAAEYKLVDVPDMNYFSTDKNEKGEPQPRGEICFRGSGNFMGYFKDIAKTNEAIDKDGWLHTGDVGMILPHTQALKIIDRKKNIFKLQQGEYVAPEKVENSYLKVRGIQEIFVYGDSLQSYCVAIAVLEKSFIEDLGKQKNITGTYEELCQNPEIVSAVLASLEKQGRADKLAGFELAKKLYIHPESMANLNCMTTTMKIQRHNAKNVFKQQIDKMYSSPLANA
ncbi:hypothetical protein ABPG72_013635 [Tetrahymena utriculariae]